MHPTLAVGLAALTWLLVHNSSNLGRVLLAVAAFMLGWEPASSGAWYGLFLVSVAAGAAASVLWEEIVGGRRAAPKPVGAAPPGERAVDGEADGLVRTVTTRDRSWRRPSRRRREVPSANGPPNDPLTELEQAELYSELLDVNIAGLEEAKRSGDLRAQAAFAGEIEDLANEMRMMLRVVLGERHRIAGPQ